MYDMRRYRSFEKQSSCSLVKPPKMKRIYIGKEGSGKTLMMGREAERVVRRNKKLLKKTGFVRPIVTNFYFSPNFVNWARSNGVPVKQWKDISELESMTECDLFIDEVGAYFDSRSFADLPLSTRLWLAQAQKLGVHIIGSAQDWQQIDVSFRRLVNDLVEVKKIVGSRRPSKTIPGSAYPWAWLLVTNLNPKSTDSADDLKTLHLIPPLLNPTCYRLATKPDTDRFDTNARVIESELPPLRKRVRVCPEDGYKQVRYV